MTSEDDLLPDLGDLSPEDLYVDDGNSSHTPTTEELIRDFRLLRCDSKDCIEEAEVIGEIQGEPVSLDLDYPRPAAAASQTQSQDSMETQSPSSMTAVTAGSPTNADELKRTALPSRTNRHLRKHLHRAHETQIP